MTVKNFIEKNGWIFNKVDTSVPFKAMNVDIGFVNEKGCEDETQFSIHAYDEKELSKLFESFCEEKGYDKNLVAYVMVSEVAETLDKLS